MLWNSRDALRVFLKIVTEGEAALVVRSSAISPEFSHPCEATFVRHPLALPCVTPCVRVALGTGDFTVCPHLIRWKLSNCSYSHLPTDGDMEVQRDQATRKKWQSQDLNPNHPTPKPGANPSAILPPYSFC